MRPLLLDAAVRVFSERGYAGATTREIAEAAGTTEALLFRHFGSKANLFEVAVLAPFTEFITAFSAEWAERDRVDTFKDPLDEFVGWLFRMLRSNQQMVLAMITAQQRDHELAQGRSMATEALDRLTDYVEHAARVSGWQGLDVALATRLVVGMVIAAGVLEDWLFAGHESADLDTRLVEEMTGIVLSGVARAPDPEPGTRIVREPELSRIVVTGPSAAAAMASAAQWLAEQGPLVDVGDLAWHPEPDGGRLHVYFRAR